MRIVLDTNAALCEDVGWRLRQKGLLAKTVTVKIRYADYSTVTRSATLPRPVCTDGAVWQAARDLFLRHAGYGPWRLVGVQVTNLIATDWRQLSLLEDPQREMREEKLAAVLDGLKAEEFLERLQQPLPPLLGSCRDMLQLQVKVDTFKGYRL